jgi:hypothetical protein
MTSKAISEVESEEGYNGEGSDDSAAGEVEVNFIQNQG